MGRLKIAADKMNHKNVVLKHRDSGRTYNHIEGQGWLHYTKGTRRRKITMDRINKAYDFLFSFLSKALPNDLEEKKISEQLDKTIESLKGEN